MEEIRRQRPDFAIVTPTFWDRMEIPARGAIYDWNQNNSHRQNALQDHLQNRAIGNGYDRLAGIRNVNYGNEPSNMICETIFSLAGNGTHPYRLDLIPKDTQTAVKHYIDQLYDSNWKKQQDEWIIREGILMMYLEGIKFIVQPNLLWPFDPAHSSQWRQAFPSLIPDHYIQLDPSTTVQALSGNHPFEGEDPGYHSSPAGQQVIADHWANHMQAHFGLD